MESVLNVADTGSIVTHEYAYDVEPVAVGGPAMSADPDLSRPGKLPSLPPVHGFHRIAEGDSPARPYFNEGDRTVFFGNEVNVAMPTSEAALHDAPTVFFEPSLCDSLAGFSESLSFL